MNERRKRDALNLTQTGEFIARNSAQDPRLGVVLRIARSLSASMGESELLETIMSGVTELLYADRSTLLLLTPEGTHLRSHVAEGAHRVEIRLPVGEGLAGWVAHTGRDLNIRDVYRDPRFDPEWDRRTGFVTKSMLCQAIRHRDGSIVGVAQAINKRDGGYFTVDDEMMMRTIMALASISIVNGQLTSSLWARNLELQQARIALEQRVREIDLLYQIEREVAEADTLETALEQLLVALQRALPCEVAQVTLAVAGGALIGHRLPADAMHVERVAHERRCGFAGRVIALATANAGRNGSGRRVSTAAAIGSFERSVAGDHDSSYRLFCGDARAEDALLAKEDDFGFVPATGLTVPLDLDGEILGTLGLYDRSGDDNRFDDADVKLISVAASSAARIVGRFAARQRVDRDTRLASLGSTLSMVLHDFRTPMTIASGYVQMMASTEDAERRGDLAAKVIRQLDRVVHMSREVLDFARGRREMLLQKVMLADFAKELEELVTQIFMGHGVEVTIEALDRGTARFDRHKLLRVVQNLARNAREAMTDATTGHADGHFQVRIEGDGKDVVLTFTDDGPGVPVAFRHQLFQAFATHGKESGTGLGLAMVKEFAESHGGSVRYAEAPGGGACFIVCMPREGPADGDTTAT